MKNYVCSACGYVYNPELGDPTCGIPAGTPFEELPDDWFCPICDLDKGIFEEE
jgi:rubredoxin